MDKVELFNANKEKIERIQTMCDNLTEWEADFIININDWLHSKGSISEKQQAVLDRIYYAKYGNDGRRWRR